MSPRQVVRLIHYNDVYNICESATEPAGGAARFVTAINSAIKSSPVDSLVVFSGDAFSPAPLTELTEGAEIPPVLNATHIEVACIGNHELDRGIAVMQQRINECNFPWLVSNIFEKDTGSPLAGLPSKHIIVRGGVKLGFIGLAAYEWLCTLNHVNVDQIDYWDFCDAANALAKQLREHDDCDFVVALTHMRQPDDKRLASCAEGIDIILGGHDHILWKVKDLYQGRWIVKSGTDFKNFSTIDICRDVNGHLFAEEPVHHAVTSTVTPDLYMSGYVDAYLQRLGKGYFENIAISKTELDGRFVSIRTQETGLGNLVCDAMASALNAPIALVNAGSFRSDSLHAPDNINRGVVDMILPFKDETVVASYTGKELHEMLENSVSQYPLLEGRFCQVSGLQFTFDPRKEAGRRIPLESIFCKRRHGKMEKLSYEQVYDCAMKTFIFDGKDGYIPGRKENLIRHGDSCLPDMFIDFLKGLPTGQSSELPVVAPKREERITCLAEDDDLIKHYNSY